MDGRLRHDEQDSRYVWTIDDEVVATMEYRPAGDHLVVHHTHTVPSLRGRGIAARLVQAALDDIAARDTRIVPTCWFVADFVDTHPEYADLVVH